MADIEVTASTSEPSPTLATSEPAVVPQVVALETAGVTDLAREQGRQTVTIEALAAIVQGQGSELAQHRATIAELREQATREAQARIEPEPEPEPVVTEIDVSETNEPAPTDGSEVTTSDETPRRERGPWLRMFLGRSV